MTAGHDVVHAEDDAGGSRAFHIVQLWVAQPSATRDGPAAFEHHAELPRDDFGGATATASTSTCMVPRRCRCAATASTLWW